MAVKANKKANKDNGNKRIQQLSDELKASKQRLSRMQGEVKDWKAKYKEQADIVRKLDRKLKSTLTGPDAAQFEKMQKDLFQARKEVETIRGNADSIAQAYNRISSDNAMLNKALKKAQQAKSTHDEDSLALIESLQNENKRLRNYKNKLHSRYEASKDDIDQLKEQVKQLVEDQKSGAKVPKTKELHTYQGVLKKDRMGQIETVYGSLNAALQDNPTVGIDELKRALNANVKLMVSGHSWQYLPYKDFDY